MVGADRQVAVAAVDEHGEAHDVRAAEVVHRVEGRTHRAAGVEDVVDQHHRLALDAARRHLGVLRAARRVVAQVVAVHRHVERTDWHVHALDVLDPGSDPSRERDAAARDAKQHELARTLVALEDLVGDPGQCPVDLTGVEHHTSGGGIALAGRGKGFAGLVWGWLGAHGGCLTSFSASPDGSLKDVDRWRD